MAKKILRIVLIVLISIVLVIIAGIVIIKTTLPRVGAAPDISVKRTREQVDRGEYLANHVMLCMDCHSQRDWSRFSGPMVPGTEGHGGEVFDQLKGFPGRYVSPNITPAKLSDWTDGEIFRAITTGVSKDGRPLFPVMPYMNYGRLSEEDIMAVIAYIRTLAPIDYTPVASKSDFPMGIILHTIPQPAHLTQKPDKADAEAYGEYMITAASCYDCHTRVEKGRYVGEPYAGGRTFQFPDGSVLRTPNLTPDITGIGAWTKEQFIMRFKVYADSGFVAPPVKKGEFQTMMPWTMYAGMRDEDLGAIYDYLMSLDPVENRVVRFEPGKAN